jgi:hypothetical protein
MLAASTILRAKLRQSDESARTVTIRSQLMIIATNCCSAQLHTGSPRGVACTPTSLEAQMLSINSLVPHLPSRTPCCRLTLMFLTSKEHCCCLALAAVVFGFSSLRHSTSTTFNPVTFNSGKGPDRHSSRICAWRMAQLVQVIESCRSRTTLTHL